MTEPQDAAALAQPGQEEAEAANTEPRQSENGNSDNGTTENDGTAENETAGAAPKKTRRKQSTARKTRSVELTLTVTGTAEGEWQAELTHAGKRLVQGLPIPASAVAKAATELHSDISDAIETVLSDARQQHEAKLAELEAEMERVKKTLAELES